MAERRMTNLRLTYGGPFRSETKATTLVEHIRAPGGVPDARLIDLAPNDAITWSEIKHWSYGGGAC
jgi:hypothetical protein